MTIRSLHLPVVLLIGFIMLTTLSGCATVDQNIDLNYAPFDRSFGRNSGDIIVSRVDAQKISKNSRGEWIVGSLNNVHGVHQADILSDRRVDDWITEALLLELKHAGYTVSYSAKIPSSTGLGILVSEINSLLRVNQGTVSADVRHELKFNVDIFLNGFKVKSLTVASRNSKTLPLSTSKEEKEKIMLQSLQDAVQQIIPEITTITGQK